MPLSPHPFEPDAFDPAAFAPDGPWVEQWPLIGGMPPFLHASVAAPRVRVRYRRAGGAGAEARLVGLARFDEAAAGPPGHVHGGALAALLDEVMVLNLWLAGYPTVAVSLTTNYGRKVPVTSEVRVYALIDAIDGRKLRTRGWLVATGTVEPGEPGEPASESAHVYCEAHGLYVHVDAPPTPPTGNA